jgi:hypothetical protein
MVLIACPKQPKKLPVVLSLEEVKVPRGAMTIVLSTLSNQLR